MSGHIKGEILAVYRDLSAEERARVDAHTAHCPVCAGRLARLQGVDAQLQPLAEMPVPPGLLRPLPVVMQRHAERERPRNLQAILPRVFGPAAVALLVIVGLWLALSSGDGTHSAATATPTYTLTPTATIVTQTALAPERTGATVQTVPVAFEPVPEPLPSPARKTGGASSPALLFFVPLEPRATIVR